MSALAVLSRKRHKPKVGARRRLLWARAVKSFIRGPFRNSPECVALGFAAGDSLAHAKDSPAQKAPQAIRSEKGLVRLYDDGDQHWVLCRGGTFSGRRLLARLGRRAAWGALKLIPIGVGPVQGVGAAWHDLQFECAEMRFVENIRVLVPSKKMWP
jgi:hypothetical protein